MLILWGMWTIFVGMRRVRGSLTYRRPAQPPADADFLPVDRRRLNSTVLDELRSVADFGSYETYAAMMRQKEKTTEIERRKVTIESEVLSALSQSPELPEMHKEALVYHIKRSKLKVTDLNIKIFADLLSTSLRPQKPSPSLVNLLWSRLENTTRDFIRQEESGLPHPSQVREARRGITDAELRKAPPITDVFAARLLVQRLLARRNSPKEREGEIEGVSVGEYSQNLLGNGMGVRVPSVEAPGWAKKPVYGKTELQVVKPQEDDNTQGGQKALVVEVIPIGKYPTYVMGRERVAVDILALHPTVSRKHAMLVHDEDGDVFIIDLKSGHGTFVNEERIQAQTPILLHEGDRIALGSSRRRYVIGYYRTLQEQHALERLHGSKTQPIGWGSSAH
ncbi:hypothetical protein AAMO2058_000266600 [Amorphochlora amoebiformis]